MIKKIVFLGIGYVWILYFSQQVWQVEEMLVSLDYLIFRGLGNFDEEGWWELVKVIGKVIQDELLESQMFCEKWIDVFGDCNMVGKGVVFICQVFIVFSDCCFEELEELLYRVVVVNQLFN